MLRITQRRQQRGESIRSIAKDFHVDESSLRKRLKRGFGVESLGKFKRTFSHDQELALAEHCRQMDVRFYGVTKKSFRQLAYQYAVQNHIPTQFNQETKLAGEQWTQSFLSRHKLTLRIPQKTSIGRIMGFNKKQIDTFFDNLTQLLRKFNFPPSRIYNMDETGITTVPNKVPKIIATKGKKSVNKVSSAERGQLVTAVCCFSAGGHYVPPALIFPRKRLKPELWVTRRIHNVCIRFRIYKFRSFLSLAKSFPKTCKIDSRRPSAISFGQPCLSLHSRDRHIL